MLEDQDEGEYNYPVDEADLCGTYPWIVLVIHYFLQLTIALLHLHARLYDVEIDTVENSSLLNDKIAHITEQITQIIHLANNVINLLFLKLSKSGVCLFDLLNYLLLLHTLIIGTVVLLVQIAMLGQSDLASHTIELSYLVNMITFNLSEPFCSIL